jgi:hypothetical protein
MDIISYVHKSVELLFKILGLVEVWTRRSMELSPGALHEAQYYVIYLHFQLVLWKQSKCWGYL